MPMSLSLLFACRVLIKLIEEARTGNPIGVRAEDALIERGPIGLFLSEFPRPHGFANVEGCHLHVILGRIARGSVSGSKWENGASVTGSRGQCGHEDHYGGGPHSGAAGQVLTRHHLPRSVIMHIDVVIPLIAINAGPA